MKRGEEGGEGDEVDLVMIRAIHEASDEDVLMKLKVVEIKRRLGCLDIDVSMFLEKRAMVVALSKRTLDVVGASEWSIISIRRRK